MFAIVQTPGDSAVQLIADDERGRIDTRGRTKYPSISLAHAKIYCVLITLSVAPLQLFRPMHYALRLFIAINRRKIWVEPIIDCYKRVSSPGRTESR